jgi:Ca-activated chloride channel family protein
MAEERFETLVQQLADGDLGEEACGELLKAIRDSESLRHDCHEHLAVDRALHAVIAGPSVSLTERVMNSLQAPAEQVALKKRVLKEIHLLDWRKKQKRRRSDYVIHLAALLVLGLALTGAMIRYDVAKRMGIPFTLNRGGAEGGMEITLLQTNRVEMDRLPDLEDLKFDLRPEEIDRNRSLAIQDLNITDPLPREHPPRYPDISLPGSFPGLPGIRIRGEANPGLVSTMEAPVSRLGTAIDSASYVTTRRYLVGGELPPPAAVKTEGFINYFDYPAPGESGAHPLGIHLEIAEAPWAPGRRLVLASVKAPNLPERETHPAHLVFLVDLSGSMAASQKLPLFKEGLRMLSRDLKAGDRVSIITAADTTQVRCEAMPGLQQKRLIDIIDRLEADGKGALENGFDLAYRIAERHLLPAGINRVVLVTDEDYPGQVTDEKYLHALVAAHREKNIRMSVLRFGPGNKADKKLRALAARGGGRSIRVDTLNQGYHALAQHLGSRLGALVEEVDIQVAFNPGRVQAYRLIGYNHPVRGNPAVAASTMRHGQALTALFEIIPGRVGEFAEPGPRPLKQAAKRPRTENWMTVDLRFRHPGSSDPQHLHESLEAGEVPGMNRASTQLQWAAAVAAFAEKLRGEEVFRYFSYEEILRLTEYGMDEKPTAEQLAFRDLVLRASSIR